MQNETSENIRLKYMVEEILEYLVYTKTQGNSSISESLFGLEELWFIIYIMLFPFFSNSVFLFIK